MITRQEWGFGPIFLSRKVTKHHVPLISLCRASANRDFWTSVDSRQKRRMTMRDPELHEKIRQETVDWNPSRNMQALAAGNNALFCLHNPCIAECFSNTVIFLSNPAFSGLRETKPLTIRAPQPTRTRPSSIG